MPTKRIFVPTQTGTDWQHLLAQPARHWKLGRSAMTAAAAWEHAADAFPPEISLLLEGSESPELRGQRLLLAIPEWSVELEGGDTTSQTDVLAVSRNSYGLCICAVEAKVDEDFGPTVGEKRSSLSEGQSRRLSYLQGLLHLESVNGAIRYQLMHRTASAILTAQQFHAGVAVMLVHSFGSRAELKQDFTAFAGAMKAVQLSSSIWRVTQFDSPKLFLGWCDGDRQFLKTEIPGDKRYL